MKICARCKVEKEEIGFTKSKNRKDGLSVYCKICKSLESKEYNKKNRDKCADKLRKWREKNPEKSKEYGKKGSIKNRDKIIARRRTKESREKMRILVNEWNKKNIEKVRETRKKAKKKNREKNKARLMIMNEIRRGRMTRPIACQICLKECKPDGHHTDYSKPLEVMWLCKVCHAHKHNKLKDIEP